MTPVPSNWPADYHSHTRLCKHASGEPRDYARAARQRGLPELATTDHGPTPLNYDPLHRMEMEQFPEYLGGVRAAQREEPGFVLLGIEADYFESCESFMADWLAAQPFDLVLGSIHYLSPPAPDRSEFKPLWNFGGIRGTWKRYFELVGKLADSGLYDIVGHLDMLKRNGSRLADKELRECALPALDRIAAAGMAIEINTSGLRHAVKEIYPSPLLLSWARERGIPIVFGSDAHQPDQVGSAFEQAVRLARESGYTDSLRFRGRVAARVPFDAASGAHGPC
ncbi:MAG TPA: histidinol-phosphatase HisJ family protein [Kiritimatiellia bacterium]|nr:histidinol-phosphatase HisJ family protein [Kiritimatiellia bacterium]HSA19746.1 histidinol-phosphatase HisJ family protein [Kiritimatiellia bacterium]